MFYQRPTAPRIPEGDKVDFDVSVLQSNSKNIFFTYNTLVTLRAVLNID